MMIPRPNRQVPVYFAFKIKDGLFIGDGQSPNQLDFLIANKITTIINCAASQVPITRQLEHIRIVNFEWLDSDDEVILDSSDCNFQSICYFIDNTHMKHEGVLVCSLRGQSRALTIITAYLIKRYKWSLYKALEYLNSKRSDFEMRANFLKQLVQLQSRLYGKKLTNCTKNWQEEEIEHEGQLVKNTYLNSLMTGKPHDRKAMAQQSNKPTSKSKQIKHKKCVKFNDFAVIINNKVSHITEEEESSIEPEKPKSKQQLSLLELNRVIEKQLIKKEKDETPRPVHERKSKSTTEIEQEPLKFDDSLLHKQTQGRRDKQPTPYRIRRNFDKTDKFKTEPKEDVQFSINLNINSINIIQPPGGRMLTQSSVRKSKQLLNQEKLKMYLNSNLAAIAKRRKETPQKESVQERRIRSSSSKRLSADTLLESKQPPRRKMSLMTGHSAKKWIESSIK